MAQTWSKRHYVAVAESLAAEWRGRFTVATPGECVERMADRWARVFRADSERFDWDRFMTAAMPA